MLAIGLAVFAMAVSEVLVLESLLVIMGSLLPLVSPSFHSLPLVFGISSVFYVLWGKRQGISFLIGCLVSLAILSISSPVSLFVPGINYSFSLFQEDFGLNIFILVLGLIIYSNQSKISNWLSSFSPQKIRKAVFSFFLVFFVLLCLFPID